jgi:hypothetical protein
MRHFIKILVVLALITFLFSVVVNSYSLQEKEAFTPYIRGKYRENMRRSRRYIYDRSTKLTTLIKTFLRNYSLI